LAEPILKKKNASNPSFLPNEKPLKGEKRKKLTPICILHYVKLTYRSLLFFAALVVFVAEKVQGKDFFLFQGEKNSPLIWIIVLIYTVEMAFRFFPSRLESMGCQKQFGKNYRPTGEASAQLQPWKRTFAVVAAWILLNGAIGLLYWLQWIGQGELILISLAYGVCDMICILFFCPFQTWWMKNRCCTVCRIYNWDYAMMFTPLVFLSESYARILLGMSLLLLIRWEVTLRRHPERFSPCTNDALACENCKEKLCHHKKQLRSFWNKNKSFFSFKKH